MFGLAFLSPAFLAAATAIAVPIFIHLFRRRTEEQIRFSAVRFLKDAPVEHARRRRIRELLLLALRVSALVLLALAFARPYFVSAESGFGAPITVVAVDVSYSMSAPGQFARAMRLAEQAIDGAPARHQVSVVAFADDAEVVTPPTSARGEARAAVARLSPGAGATRYRAALARSGEVAGATGRIVLITDLQQSGWAGGESEVLLPPGVAIEIADVGAAGANLAVIDLRREAGGLSARVQNTGAAPREGIVRLMVNDTLISEAKFSVAPHAVADARFDDSDATSGLASATLTDPDGFAADNTRYLLLDPPVPVTVMAVTSAASPADIFYLERALASGGHSSPFRVVSRAAVSFEGVDRASLRPYPLLWLLGTRNLDRRGRTAILDYVRDGGALAIAVGPDVEPDVVADLLGDDLGVRIGRTPASEALSFAPVDARHPIFRAFGPSASNLSMVRFTRSAGIADGGQGRRLAVFSNGTGALVEYSVGQGRVLVFGSDLSNRWNDFPLQPTFVPFVHEIMRYLTGSALERTEILVGDLPPGLPRRPGLAVLPGPRRPGSRANRPAGGSPSMWMCANRIPRGWVSRIFWPR